MIVSEQQSNQAKAGPPLFYPLHNGAHWRLRHVMVKMDIAIISPMITVCLCDVSAGVGTSLSSSYGEQG